MTAAQYTHKIVYTILPDKQVAWLSYDTGNTNKTQSLGESGGKKEAKITDKQQVMGTCLFMVGISNFT